MTPTTDLGPISRFLYRLPWPARVQIIWCDDCRAKHIGVFVRHPDGKHWTCLEPRPLDVLLDGAARTP